MTFGLNESVSGFGDMSFADPYLEASQEPTRARIAVPRPADFEMDPYSQWDDIEEEVEEEHNAGTTTRKNKYHLDAVSPPPLTNTGSSSLQFSPDMDVSHQTPRGQKQIVTGSSRSPSSRSTSTRQIRLEEMQATRLLSGRRRHSTDADSPPKRQTSNSLSPHYRVSRRHLLQEQRTPSQDVMASSKRRLSEPSRRNIRAAAIDMSGALASHEVSPSSSRRSSDPTGGVQQEKAESSPTSAKSSHHRRTTSRAASRRNLLGSSRSDKQDSPTSHRTVSTSRRKPLDRSCSDGQAEVRRSVTGISSRLLVAPSRSDTRTYNGSRNAVARSSSDGSRLPKDPSRESRRDHEALLPPNLSPNQSKDHHENTHRSESPSRSRRKLPRSSHQVEEGDRTGEKTNTRSRSRSKSRRNEGSSRRERRTSSPSHGNDKPRARSKSRDASSRRHNLRTSGGRTSKTNDHADAFKILQSILLSQDSGDNDDNFDSSEDLSGRNKNPADLLVGETPRTINVSSPTSSSSPSLGEMLSSAARRRSSPGLGQQSPYVMSNQATKDKREESKLRRSNIMKSLKGLLHLDAENLKVEVREDGTKRLVVELSDLNTVMEDFVIHKS